jgi:hypothetical protein
MFEVEREFYADYKQGIEGSPRLFAEVIGAIDAVLTRYNTTVWENRFIVGGVVEQIIGASARSLGFAVENAGKQNQGYDLELVATSETGISIKGVFASMGGRHNLVNARSERLSVPLDRWTTATMFVMSDVGIGYTDPEYGRAFLHSTSDALQISGAELQSWWRANPRWLVAAEIPRKPEGPAVRVASDAVSMDLFADFPLLRGSWRAEI